MRLLRDTESKITITEAACCKPNHGPCHRRESEGRQSAGRSENTAQHTMNETKESQTSDRTLGPGALSYCNQPQLIHLQMRKEIATPQHMTSQGHQTSPKQLLFESPQVTSTFTRLSSSSCRRGCVEIGDHTHIFGTFQNGIGKTYTLRLNLFKTLMYCQNCVALYWEKYQLMSLVVAKYLF